MKRWRWMEGAVALGVIFLARDAGAGPTCSVSGVVGVSFGAYDVFTPTQLDSAGTLTVTCSGVGPSDTIVIHLSPGSSGTFASRTMTFGGYALAYNLYLDAGRNSVWGDGSAGTSTIGPLTPQNGANAFSVYGRVGAQQNVGVGSYGDTIVATVLY